MHSDKAASAIELRTLLEAQTKLPIRASAPTAATLPPGRLAAVDDGTNKRLYFNFNGVIAHIDFVEG